LGTGEIMPRESAFTGAGLDSTAELLRRMAADEFDLIAVGRALISHPDWPLKVLDEHIDELKPFERNQLETLV
jgi:2,4-dienoyl-CoA reductase-like NADH-dependent reductase (Old Yellow Enzyme family)